MQGGNLINLRRRGSGRADSSGPQGEWEQWPEEAAAGTVGQNKEDDDMQRAIAASLADPDQGIDCYCCCCCLVSRSFVSPC